MWGIDKAVEKCREFGIQVTEEEIAAEKEKETERMRALVKAFDAVRDVMDNYGQTDS